MTVLRNGKQYERKGEDGVGRPSNARQHASTMRYDIFFDASRDGKTKSWVRAWREETGERAEQELVKHYTNDGYSINVDSIEVIEGSES